ncbi:MAG: SPOR domain-containing protein [Deferribacterota bacterium]|nr:SPOR domain-containing protein [Deferribacterota bacterium]
MIEIDLLKFIDKSYSEIDEILHKKGGYEEELEEKKEIKGALDKKSVFRPFKYASIILILCIVVFICFKFLYPRIMDVFNNSKPTTREVAEVVNEKLTEDTEVTQKLQDQLENKNNNEIVVATIDFLVDNLSEYVPSDSANDKVNIDSEKVKEEVRKALYKVKLYYIKKADLDRINSFASMNNLNVEKLGTNVNSYSVWSLYVPKKGTNKYIGEREVAFIKSFKNKKEAIDYAKNKGVNAIIVKESRKKYSYDVIVEGFNNKEDANDFINEFNIEREKIRIERIKTK